MLYEITVPQFNKMLRNLNEIIDKATANAAFRKFDPDVLLQARLAPDQFPLLRQIQIVTDTAKLGVARINGKEAPKHDDTEKTWPELKARIESVIKYLETYSAKDFVGAAERRVTTPRWEGKTLSGAEFTTHHMIPNFYFHLTTAYSILRHNGVDLGKRDYLGPMPFQT